MTGLAVLAALALVAAVVALYLVFSERRRHREIEARLLEEAKVREAARAQLSDQLITAEQDERRRLALFLHDGPVQSMAGIALMLDGAQHAIETDQLEQAKTVIASALDRHRQTIRELRDLSFNLEPVVLRDQGFGTAVRALGEMLGMANEIKIDVDVEPAEELAENTQAALYQIIREALNGAIRRGPPTEVTVKVEHTEDGGIATVIADDAPAERRRTSFDAIAERARAIDGRFSVEQGEEAGTTVRVDLPAYTV